jgi:hypothetical protein
MRSILANILVTLGPTPMEGDSHVNAMLRPMVYRAAAFYGDVNATQFAMDTFAAQKDGDIPVEIRDFVYFTVVQYGGEEEYNWMLER